MENITLFDDKCLRIGPRKSWQRVFARAACLMHLHVKILEFHRHRPAHWSTGLATKCCDENYQTHVNVLPSALLLGLLLLGARQHDACKCMNCEAEVKQRTTAACTPTAAPLSGTDG